MLNKFKYSILLLLFLIIVNPITTSATLLEGAPTKSKLETKGRLDYITAEQQAELNRIRTKVERGEMLSDKDKQILREINNTVAKAKLGEEKFNELQSLMSKRKAHKELTPEEESRVKELLKELQS